MQDKFSDGKEIYDAALRLINSVSPKFAAFIHATPTFKPFSTVLPDIVTILEPILEGMIKQVPGINVIDEFNYRDCFTEVNQRLIKLYFEKTFFKRAQTSYPLPDPWKIISSWKNRWNSIFPEKISIRLPLEHNTENERIELHYVNINTKKVVISDYRPTYYTFCGYVKFKWLGNDDELKQLWALARFAEFAGTGAKTTMGCGITKIIKEEGEANAL